MWGVAGRKYIVFKLSEPSFSLFPLTVDSPDLLLGMVHNCDTPDGGAVHNSSEGCHR